MDDHSFMHSVVPVIRWIDDRQEHRQRPIIYIGIETMSRELKPAPSCQKAIRLLIEHYEVFFVSPPPLGGGLGETVQCATTLSWLYEHINVPAWQHTIFTPRRELLYGDYFIQGQGAGGKEQEVELMATPIEFGSDTFKTWDDIIEYFSRLGGQ